MSELTPRQKAAAILLAFQAANWAIENAVTKFTPEQEDKIRENAVRDYLRDALPKVRASRGE